MWLSLSHRCQKHFPCSGQGTPAGLLLNVKAVRVGVSSGSGLGGGSPSSANTLPRGASIQSVTLFPWLPIFSSTHHPLSASPTHQLPPGIPIRGHTLPPTNNDRELNCLQPALPHLPLLVVTAAMLLASQATMGASQSLSLQPDLTWLRLPLF